MIAAGIVLRQVDRWWFSPVRGRRSPESLRAVLALQRSRANDLTPVLLLTGHWLELVGWWTLAVSAGPVGWPAVALAVAVKFRHLQEVSHFAVHGVLTRSGKAGTVLAEMAVHGPLGFVPVPVRRARHVRQHHPNATVAGIDPNLADLRRAGLHPGAGPVRFALAVVFPLTPRGLLATCRDLGAAVRPRGARSWWRPCTMVIVPVAVGAIAGWPVALVGLVVPRLLLYPQLAWLSLLVEHRWFDAVPATGSPAAVEAGRCLRLYPRSRFMALLARATWLPYGDLFHYAHSVHPAVRWNYLPALERALGTPAYTPDGLVLGNSVTAHHYRALTAGLTGWTVRW